MQEGKGSGANFRNRAEWVLVLSLVLLVLPFLSVV